ncbi:hypothetical protein [Dyadobacter koreensis]|nr:hypothetical protein [Dyadobacter koreensis]
METFSFAATAMAATAVIEILENKKIAINGSDLSGYGFISFNPAKNV